MGAGVVVVDALGIYVCVHSELAQPSGPCDASLVRVAWWVLRCERRSSQAPRQQAVARALPQLPAACAARKVGWLMSTPPAAHDVLLCVTKCIYVTRCATTT